MSGVLRSAGRAEEPRMPSGSLTLQAPPPLVENTGAGGLLMNAIPLMGSVASIAVVATMGGGDKTRAFVAAGLFLFATIGFIVVQVDRARRSRANRVQGSRSDYLRYLAGVRDRVRTASVAQREALTWHFPDPEALPALAEERSRIWERNPLDPRFLNVRIGLTDAPLALELLEPAGGQQPNADPVAASALHRLVQTHRVQSGLPATLDLRVFDRVELCGPTEGARALARAVIASATAFHGPDQLQVAVLCSDNALTHWDWVKWLPHAQSSQGRDAVGPRRMVTTSVEELSTLLPKDLADRPRFGTGERQVTPHVLLVLDGGLLPEDNHLVPADGLHGVTVLDLREHWVDLDTPHRIRLECTGPADDGRVPAVARQVGAEDLHVFVDLCDLTVAEAFARRLTPLHVTASGVEARTGDIGANSDLMELLGLGDVHTLDPATSWRPRPARDRLRVPVGVGDNGSGVHLDLKESAQQGMGPHGLVIGATGSGKSEFLRTLVLGLAMTHSPEQLNLVLVDFKGGATFSGMADLPHTSAVITNLADELTLVDRMQDALSGEMVRRQELLRRSGNFSSVRDYERARAAGEPLDPMPSLFIVVDEFSELLSAKPEFIDLFGAIGRLGRSLGLHLLLASQRLDEGRLRGLESHLSYRIGLRTFSAAESRTVLGVPDAYELPAVPGLGYLKPDQSTLVRFKSSFVSGPPAGPSRVLRDEGGHVQGILPFTISEVFSLEAVTAPEPAPIGRDSDQPSLLEVAVGRLAGHGPRAHQVWLPPLDVPDTLDRLFGDLAADPALGLVSPQWRAKGGLVVPLGTVDRPREQRRDTLTLDLSGSNGHVAVVGGPRGGKSTLLRSIAASLSLVNTPQEAQFYVLDFGGGTFAPMARHPHVAGMATRSEPDVVRRVVAEVTGIVDHREGWFREQGIDSAETYRARRREGLADDGYGDVFLFVDGWSTLRAEFEDLELELQTLAGRGLTFGVHLVTSATRWADYRAAMRDLLGSRLELRLGDALDSEVDRKAAKLVPERPGRGLVPGKLHFLSALPRIDGTPTPDTVGEGLEHLARTQLAAWTGPPGPKLRLLPQRIERDRVLADAADAHLPAREFVLGIDERALAPVALDVDVEPHLLVFGDGQSGKSTLLRGYLSEVVRGRSAAEAQVVLVDYRRSLLGEVPDDYLLHYLTNAGQAQPAVQELADYLQSRIPGPEVTPEQLRNRSWWTGAEVFVVVDDYDLVATSQSSPIALLAPLLAQARDVGLHLVVARRSGGASRALYEPVIQGLRDLATPGLLLSGSPDEGALLGNVRPQPAPPGRATLVTRGRGAETIQVAWAEPRV